ncbi:hypothetical protein [Nonomuraea polychroma]|nr:hypothetical protein [Nonomuraea polychroma]
MLHRDDLIRRGQFGDAGVGGRQAGQQPFLMLFLGGQVLALVPQPVQFG